jgi:hypothetical protein
MRDYEITQWVDFVRGVLEPPERDAMQQHLDSGCAECAGMVEFLRGVVAATPAMPVPDAAVAAAKRVFVQMPHPAGTPAWLRLPALAAKLVYSSLQAPLPAGIRAVHPEAVHLVYDAGPYTLELQIERQADSAEVLLVGQFADRGSPGQAPEPMPVYLATASKTVASTMSNEFGEFSLVCRPQANLRLSIPIQAEGRRVEVALADSLTEEI